MSSLKVQRKAFTCPSYKVLSSCCLTSFGCVHKNTSNAARNYDIAVICLPCWQDDPRLVEEGPGHLDIKIRSASRADDGDYQCRARSLRDSASGQAVTLTILAATSIIGGLTISR
jgi:hypothetical protein